MGNMKAIRTTALLLSFLALSGGMGLLGGQKKGLILGGGLGIGSISSTQDYGGEIWRWHETAAAVNLKAGYALSNRWELYAFGSGSILGGRTWDVIGIAGVGATFYPGLEGRGLFFLGGLGISFFDFERDALSPDLGLLLGVGYGLSEHWSLQADVVHAGISTRGGFHEGERALQVRLTLNFLVF
jgi:hypothetical protein